MSRVKIRVRVGHSVSTSTARVYLPLKTIHEGVEVIVKIMHRVSVKYEVEGVG